ncbi:hypothetical protein AGLY_007031 [Aphis glycines]|uniref:Uncharacterized protein n=1 Tax=Aphis glycines TaxID=307491 RepID=A0A6G0TQC0_APHGL|nr:hypothetical protein AGLY_007031 [Aphis glycines]
MYSYNFLITIRITYEELCIKFTRSKKVYRHFKKTFSEKLKISVFSSIYDLHFLNNNKYQKSFEAKPLFNAVLKIYGEPCTKFSKLSYKRKKFYDFSTSKLLANFRIPLTLTFGENFKLVMLYKDTKKKKKTDIIYLLYASAASDHLSSIIHAKPSLNHKFSCNEFILREFLK